MKLAAQEIYSDRGSNQIIDLGHALVRLADGIDAELADLFSDRRFGPRLETRFMVGPLLLKRVYRLSNASLSLSVQPSDFLLERNLP